MELQPHWNLGTLWDFLRGAGGGEVGAGIVGGVRGGVVIVYGDGGPVMSRRRQEGQV
jgi:hypothetical protein